MTLSCSPWVAWFLRAAALQFLHQHLAAASQGITELPEGAAAPQRAASVLQGAVNNWNLTLCFIATFELLKPLIQA